MRQISQEDVRDVRRKMRLAGEDADAFDTALIGSLLRIQKARDLLAGLSSLNKEALRLIANAGARPSLTIQFLGEVMAGPKEPRHGLPYCSESPLCFRFHEARRLWGETRPGEAFPVIGSEGELMRIDGMLKDHHPDS